MWMRYILFLFSMVSCFLLIGCNPEGRQINSPFFTVLEHHKTGLDFSNTLTPSDSLNMFNYMYFYNGAGIGAGDFNNDGLIDLFFASNQNNNKLFINNSLQ